MKQEKALYVVVVVLYHIRIGPKATARGSILTLPFDQVFDVMRVGPFEMFNCMTLKYPFIKRVQI